MAQNTTAGPLYYTCIAVSASADALDQYFRYSYLQPALPDDPKWGLWADAYYQSQNMFQPPVFTFLGARPCAYDRASLILGLPATQECYQLTATDDSLLPADLDSPANLPPASQPEVFLGSIGYLNNTVYEYTLKPVFAGGTGMTGPTPVTVNPYTLACGGSGGNCIPQPGVPDELESVGDRLMYRLAYRRSAGGYQQWLTNHAVDTGTTVGERWYEFRAPLGLSGPPALSVFQQGTFSPDATYRWMGSIASDRYGDILLGYSTSSSTQYPSINYTGRLPSSPRGALGGEALLFSGAGSRKVPAETGVFTPAWQLTPRMAARSGTPISTTRQQVSPPGVRDSPR